MRPHALPLILALLATAPLSAQVAPNAGQAPLAASAPAGEAAPAPTQAAPSAPSTAAAAVDAGAIDADAHEPAGAPAATDAAAGAAVSCEDPADCPAATATADSATTGQPTDAEREFDALYGAPPASGYNPVADPTLPAPAHVPGAYDPWQRYNRQMHRINNAVDRRVARPLARAYVAVVPRPVRLGVSNFFNNLGQPVSAINALLQGKPRQAAHALGRFALNSTLGIGGLFDPASDAHLQNRSEDFGQTLGVWGWKRSRYVELPLFGPRTVRDVFGMVGDAPLSPLRQVEADRTRIPLQGLQLVDVRTQLLSTDSLREGAEDDYALVRDAWSQRRDYQIFGDRQIDNADDELPDYLREENNPTVPVDAMPVMPTDGS